MGNIVDALAAKKILVSDGAWGTMLQSFGLKTGECPELLNEISPEIVLKVAKSYVLAGSDIIETNSFGGSKVKLQHFNLQDKCFELNKKAAEISRQAAGDSLVIGSVGPTGKFISMGEISDDELYESFYTQMKGLVSGGVDGICIETFYDLDEAKVAIRAAKEFKNIDVITTFTFDKTPDENYFSIMGVDPQTMASMLIDLQVDIIGSNCGNGFENMVDIVGEIRKVSSDVPVLIHANAGIPELIDNKIVYNETPEFVGEVAVRIINVGANIIGGCCGTTPEHISNIRKQVDKLLREMK
ncbi:MAG: methionine synthase [Ignavibacteriales bacterium CG_4_9_14_3_um_filter_34_10]|nr:MAG: methionine synthase [Ignavibacteriales bacterium CG_4_9_14_3_um_filter_34_10]